jgi:hypothetical protein
MALSRVLLLVLKKGEGFCQIRTSPGRRLPHHAGGGVDAPLVLTGVGHIGIAAPYPSGAEDGKSGDWADHKRESGDESMVL